MAVEISWVWPGSSRRVPEVAGSSHDDQSVSAKRGAPSKSNVSCCFHPGKYGDTPRVSEGQARDAESHHLACSCRYSHANQSSN